MTNAGATAVPNPHEKLVKVFDSEQESEVMVVRGLLESAGIPTISTSLDAQQDVFPIGGVIIQVRQEQADEARHIIKEYESGGPQAAEEAESESELEAKAAPPE